MLEAVIPLVRRDLDRFRILERSIAAHFSALEVCWVVVPDHERREMAAAIKHPRYRVVPETEIVPELAGSTVKGWYKQQLVKLAIAEHVESDYYLLFDSDVICARRVTEQDLLSGGKAVCHRYRKGKHAKWYRWAQRVLRMPRSGWVHAVTPTILSKHAVHELAAHVGQLRPRPGPWWRDLISLGKSWMQPNSAPPKNWRQLLLESLPWTEYGLYFTFLEAAGRFDHYHVHSDISLCGQSVWKRNSFADWRPTVESVRSRPFILVQSIAQIPPADVMQRVEHLFAA